MNENINTPTNNTKQLLIIIIAIIAIVVVVGTVNYILVEQDDTTKNSSKYEDKEENQNTSSNKDKEKEENNEKEEQEPVVEQQPQETNDYKNIEQLTYESFNKMIKDKRSFVVVISQTYCSHCIESKPIYNAAFENRTAKGYELDLLTITTSQRTEVLEKYSIVGTPTTLIFIDGKYQPDRLEGKQTKEALTNFLDMYGFI